jgi:hypothetical protein
MLISAMVLSLTDDDVAGTGISVTPLHPSDRDDVNDPTVVQALRTESRIRHPESIHRTERTRHGAGIPTSVAVPIQGRGKVDSLRV